MARSRLQNIVKTALIADGWEITHDPLELRIDSNDTQIDLESDDLLGAMQGGQKIAVEVKSLTDSDSTMDDFHEALGRFINYRSALQKIAPERQLYLAVPNATYNGFFQLKLLQQIVQSKVVKLVVYNIASERLESWHESGSASEVY